MEIWDIFGHLVHFVHIWYIFPGLVSCTKKNLETLVVAVNSKVVGLAPAVAYLSLKNALGLMLKRAFPS
jgi:hypothetical protein